MQARDVSGKIRNADIRLRFPRKYQQLHEKLYTTPALRSEAGMRFIRDIGPLEILCNAVIALISPGLYDVGLSSMRQVRAGYEMASRHPVVDSWPSVFQAMQVIVNRSTIAHRDDKAFNTAYDLLVSLGTHRNARLRIRDLGTSLLYKPGAMIALSGRMLIHQVEEWEGGERICLAHFMRDNVHQRQHLARPPWSLISDYDLYPKSGM